MSHWGPMGIHLGYPVCCVREFCDHIKHDRMPGRIAGDGPWSGTGFIPCAAHRAQILAGVSVESLITNRRSRHPFPQFSMVEADEFMRGMGLALL